MDRSTISSSCRDLAGHEGAHDNKEKNHTCSKRCYLYEISLNCNDACSLRAGHQSQHNCNSPQNTRSTKCSLEGCNNLYVVAIEFCLKTHQFYEKYFQRKRIINGQIRKSGSQNYFRDLDPNAENFCGNEHVCTEEFKMWGIY
ncbi:hypothetical protein SUGI_0679960 [Cryptomeria japonica]|nr:hypothetical protein SUGI_0679960 [Cryptomeria japonica]